MYETTAILAGTAALIGLGHTLCGPDHYLPFIVMGKANRWSMPKTLWITFLCGLGHVAGNPLTPEDSGPEACFPPQIIDSMPFTPTTQVTT